MTRVDRQSHSERGEDKLHLPAPMFTVLLRTREPLWRPGEALKSREFGGGRGSGCGKEKENL